MFKQFQFVVVAGAMIAASNASAGMYEDLLAASDAGKCIETAAAEMVQANPDSATDIVAVALRAASQREAQQRALGCKGDIAAQAIASGADPDQVLEATAAGIAPGAGAPANLGGIGGGTAGGGAGTASAS